MKKNFIASLAMGMFLLGATIIPITQANATSIVEVSIPVNSSDGWCGHPLADNVWSVSAPPFPLNINIGIGFILNPSLAYNYDDLTLHDHVYVDNYVPDPTRAVVTYKFDEPVIVDQIEIIQHTNGITRIEGFVGNSLDSLLSIGSIFGPSGDASVLTEYQSQVFDFNNTSSGKYFQFIVRKTSLSNGYAAYRAFPCDVQGNRFNPAQSSIPEPITLTLLSIGFAGLFVARRQRKQKKK